MKRVTLNVLIIVFSLVLLISVFTFFKGSLEMYPTQEQIGKVKIVSLVFFSVNLIADVIVIRLRTRK